MKLQALFFAGALTLAAADPFPLANGNRWTFRDSSTGSTFTITAGLPFAIGGKVYNQLRGYVAGDVLARVAEDGQLVYLDSDTGVEKLLTPLAATTDWARAPRRICDDSEARLNEREAEPVRGPAGHFPAALDVRYRSNSCADAGLIAERFVPQIGLVRRVEQTIAGPRTYDLVFARVGRQTIEARPSGGFTAAVSHRPGAPEADVTLRLAIDGQLKLEFPNGQLFEIVLRDDAGQIRWRWSDTQAFTQALQDREFSTEWNTTVRMPAPALQGRPSAVFTLAAWITNMGTPAFATTVPVVFEAP